MLGHPRVPLDHIRHIPSARGQPKLSLGHVRGGDLRGALADFSRPLAEWGGGAGLALWLLVSEGVVVFYVRVLVCGDSPGGTCGTSHLVGECGVSVGGDWGGGGGRAGGRKRGSRVS